MATQTTTPTPAAPVHPPQAFAEGARVRLSGVRKRCPADQEHVVIGTLCRHEVKRGLVRRYLIQPASFEHWNEHTASWHGAEKLIAASEYQEDPAS